MKRPRSSAQPRSSNIEIVRLVWLAIFISVFSFMFYQRQGDILLYGDAVAHINIARRVFDSRTPGLLQLGTVWLPLPHLLIMPFVISVKMWQSGTGGSIPSMAAFVLGTLGIFRLVRTVLRAGEKTDVAARIACWASAIIYAANPNLIYMQSTAMGEPLYLAFFIWSIAYFAEFARGNIKSLARCGLCLAAACLTRYDGWFLAAVLVALVLLTKSRAFGGQASELASGLPRGVVLKFVLIASAALILWLAYNAAVYRNPLEFVNGPYSAKAIERKTATVNPAKGNLIAAGSYFLKAAELNVGQSTWPGRLWLALAVIGSLAAWINRRRVLLLLWTPLLFYALSIAYGSVPIFVPTWWPFSYYNVRYGLQLLPAFAVFVPMGISFLVQSATKMPRVELSLRPWANTVTMLVILLLAALSYGAIWRADPICYREAEANMRGRVALDKQLGVWMKSFPANSTLLMYLGEHVGALEQAGIPLQRTINEGNHRVWKQPFDPDGLWERALADPDKYADFVIASEGDPVWAVARDRHLTALVEIHTTGQPPTAIFQARTLSLR
ncbi:MAG: hypothetical protein ABR874_20565 [Candidatus Sulfotelmatobacter sp.]|jgi:hypothetical protein